MPRDVDGEDKARRCRLLASRPSAAATTRRWSASRTTPAIYTSISIAIRQCKNNDMYMYRGDASVGRLFIYARPSWYTSTYHGRLDGSIPSRTASEPSCASIIAYDWLLALEDAG